MILKNHHKEAQILSLVKTHQQKVFNLAYSIVRHEEEARDIVQDVFLKAYEHLDEFRGEAELSTWLYRITYNHALNVLKKNAKTNFSVLIEGLEDADDASTPAWVIPIAPRYAEADFQAEQHELKAIIWEALDQLSIPQRTAFLLHHYDGFSHKEIAAIMNKTVASVESLIFRAKQRLQQILQDVYASFKENSKNFSKDLSK